MTVLAVVFAHRQSEPRHDLLAVGVLMDGVRLVRPAERTENSPTPGMLRVEPQWDSLRDDPRFQRLLES